MRLPGAESEDIEGESEEEDEDEEEEGEGEAEDDEMQVDAAEDGDRPAPNHKQGHNIGMHQSHAQDVMVH